MPPESSVTPKSILKQPSSASTSTRNGKPVNPRHLDVALHHATILEQRKAVEAQVLDAILTLMEFPPSPHADPKQPSFADARAFTHAVAAFQPADYDALIEERNIADKCGYALCPRPKMRARSSAKKHFVDTHRGVEIVDRKLLEVWCSDDCARRAMYVKVQLNEDPAWLRGGIHGEPIALMCDNAQDVHALSTLPLRSKEAVSKTDDDDDDDDNNNNNNNNNNNININNNEDDIDAAWAAHDTAAADLARERGEKPGALTKANSSLVHDTITEHASSHVPPQPPTLPAGATMAIEGHVPRQDRPKDDDDDDDDDDAQDWEKHLPG